MQSLCATGSHPTHTQHAIALLQKLPLPTAGANPYMHVLGCISVMEWTTSSTESSVRNSVHINLPWASAHKA